MAYDWSARCTEQGCPYGARTGSYANISSRAARHAKRHGHTVDLSQDGAYRMSVPSSQSAQRCESSLPFGF